MRRFRLLCIMQLVCGVALWLASWCPEAAPFVLGGAVWAMVSIGTAWFWCSFFRRLEKLDQPCSNRIDEGEGL